MQSIILGGGCFWCLDAVYRQVKGINASTCGYAGGDTPNPDYETASSGSTGHAEVVKLSFDPQVISLKTILEVFWTVHDPTTLNRQGADVGTQYRSAIYFQKGQEPEVKRSLEFARSLWGDNITTEIKADQTFYEAETYHQNFFFNHPEQAYCQVVINPKLKKLLEKFKEIAI